VSELSGFQVFAAGLQLVPALVLAVLGWEGQRETRSVDRPGSLPRHLPHPAILLAAYYLLAAALWLVPTEVHIARGPVVLAAYALSDVILVASLAVLSQVQGYFASGGRAPGSRWLAVNYGAAAVVAGLAVLAPVVMPFASNAARIAAGRIVLLAYCTAIGSVMMRRVRRNARPGSWRPAGVGGPRHRDVALLACGLALSVLGLFMLATGRLLLLGPIVQAGVGLALSLPYAIKFLGGVVRGVLFVLLMLLATGAVYVASVALLFRVDPAVRPVIVLLTLPALIVAAAQGQAWARAAIDRVVFRRSRRRGAELQTFVQNLSPELGAVECCRRAVTELGRVMHLRGAAIVLRDGEAVACGALSLDRLAAAWPRGDALDRLPARFTPSDLELGTLPAEVSAAAVEAEVVAGVAIASHRRRWGTLLISTSLLGTVFPDEDAEAVHGLTDQLGLVLDAADLLARAVGVERALAHAEKLAAIGELAARIAHEIRNPVTAARSLAQQLAREPASPDNAEHAALILSELERVERQVRGLLQFARRDAFTFAPTDLGALVETTVDAFRGRLAAAGVGVVVEAVPRTVARADVEKLRQVLVNLIENALDALRDAPEPRRLAFGLAGSNGTVRLSVRDTGPGVPAETLPRLFEPFFSLKPHGTGLGLAIVKRTIDAHGGRITAERAAGGGLAFHIDLPSARELAG
jgi:signal transduction histidine kinase